jgi:hypothetical protein
VLAERGEAEMAQLAAMPDAGEDADFERRQIDRRA